MSFEAHQSTERARGAAGDAAARLSRDAAELVRAEARGLGGEILSALRLSGVSAALLGGAAISGVLALASAHQALLHTLERRLSPPAAAGTLALGYGAAGAGLAVLGWRQLRAAGATTADAASHAKDTAATAAAAAQQNLG